MWLIEEKAKVVFISLLNRALHDAIKHPESDNEKRNDDQNAVPNVNSVKSNLIKPYIPNLSKMPARITEPAVKLSV